MWQSISNALRDVSAEWGKLSSGKKSAAMVVGLFVVASLVGLGMWVGEKSYAPLYTDLQPQESINLVKILQQDNIPYSVSTDGKTISIPPELVQPTLMRLAVKGVDGGQKPGMEIFDKESFGTSSYVQRINFVRALQGELTRTITTLKAVKKADVHISMPPKSSFLEESEDPKASVVVELYPGQSLTKQEVSGVQHLVASSVERLRPERVTVVDSGGRVLSINGDPMSALSLNMMENQRRIEADLESRVQDIVGRIVGQGQVVARVNAELDLDTFEEQETVYDPEQTAVTSSDKQENLMQGSRGSPTGAAGVEGSLPGGPEPASIPETSQKVEKVDTKNRYAVSKKIKQQEKAIGSIKRLSVAVLVDEEKTKAEDGKVTSKPLSDEKKAIIAKLVKDAVGFVDKRDSISVESAAFASIDLDQADDFLAQKEQRQLIYSLIKYGTIALIILLFFVMIVRPFIRWLTGLSNSDVTQVLPKTVEELEMMQEPETDALPGLANLPLFEERVDVDKAESDFLKDKIISLINVAPNKAAHIITDWLSDGYQPNKKN